jgi:serine/threonine-protein kinase
LPKTLFGYDVVSRIGKGAVSSIYAVTDATGQIYALKHVKKVTEKDERHIEQLENEFEMSRQFRHPNLRRCIDFKTPRRLFGKPNEAALVMEMVDGRPLEDRAPSSLAQVYTIFGQVAAALASLHHLRLVHCDMKPHNVMRCDGDKIKIIDFGQACKIGTAKPRVQGTPDYISPEQVKCLPVDARTDIYNFGATLYWALTGRTIPTYFTVGKSERNVVKKQEFPSPRDHNAGIPEDLSRLVMHCVRYHPEDRPQDILRVLKAMEACNQNPTRPT